MSDNLITLFYIDNKAFKEWVDKEVREDPENKTIESVLKSAVAREVMKDYQERGIE